LKRASAVVKRRLILLALPCCGSRSAQPLRFFRKKGPYRDTPPFLGLATGCTLGVLRNLRAWSKSSHFHFFRVFSTFFSAQLKQNGK
jgi:hypothetical protein